MAEARDRYDSSAQADTQTDAVPEAIQLDPSSEDTECDPNLISKRRVQQETTVKTKPATWNLSERTDDNGIIDFTPFLPKELKYDYFEILILNAEIDDNEAINLKDHIENNVTFCRSLKPNVVLLKDVIPINEVGDALDDAFKRTMYVILYVTEEFCKQSLHLFQSHSCLKRALTSKEEQWSIIPVHTSPKNERKYELPLMLDGLRPLNYFSKSFNQDVKKLLEHKSNVIMERRITLDEKRQQYIDAKYKELCKLRSLGLGIQNVMVPALKMTENSPDIPIKASVSNSESQNTISAEAQEQNQVTDSNCRSSQQKTKNTAAIQQQQQQQQMNTKGIFTKKSYLRPKISELEDISLSITTDSPTDAEICEESSEKDISLENSKQVGLQSGFDFNKSCYSNPVKTSTVKYSSLPEPADDKAIPEDLTRNTFNATESNVNHMGSHINLSTGHSRNEGSDILSEDGSHPHFNIGLQRGSRNTVPIIPVTFSGASPSSSVRDVPRSSRSRRMLSENMPIIPGSQVHIHIHQATNVAIGKHSQINVDPLLSRSDDTDDSEDSENGNSYEI